MKVITERELGLLKSSYDGSLEPTWEQHVKT